MSRDGVIGQGAQNGYKNPGVNRSVIEREIGEDYREKNYVTNDGKSKGANLYARSGIHHNRPPH